MNSFRARALCLNLLLLLACALGGRADILLSEFLASNNRTLADEDGEYSDWVELFNSGNEPADLSGWFLTDDDDRLTKWQFPATTVLPHEHLVVFASNKDRAVTGRPLHTNFRLSSSSGYLALVKPDGFTLASVFGPAYPKQFTDISYGRAISVLETALVAQGAKSRILVPANDLLERTWYLPETDDSLWSDVANGVGFESINEPLEPMRIADSAEDFSSEQGFRGWYYGYYNRTVDGGGNYSVNDFIAFLRNETTFGAENYWDGTKWRYGLRSPPHTEIAATTMRPNSTGSGGFEHWAIRRWISPFTGVLRANVGFAKEIVGGTGVTFRIYRRGLQTLNHTIAGDDVVGTNLVSEFSVNAGDRVDFALLPQGKGDGMDLGDLARVHISLSQMASLAGKIGTDIGQFMAGKNATAWLRIPFEAANPGAFEHLFLNVQSDDGFIAYLNGHEIASANAPASPRWNSAATAPTADGAAIQPIEFDLSSRLGLLRSGSNLLAIHLLNSSAEDTDALCATELIGRRITPDPISQIYFSPPTPGAFNGPGNTNLGPVILSMRHQPFEPTTNDPVTVTAQIARTFQTIGEISLTWRLMYSNAVTIPMLDDGAHGDGAAGDGVYGATISPPVVRPGHMLRWYVSAADISGNRTRLPAFGDRLRSPEFEGTVYADPSLTNPLPVFHYFVQSPGAADSGTTRCSIYYGGVFYDNVTVGIHGQSSREFPKKSYNFDMNPGIRFRYSQTEEPVDDFNLLTTYADKSKLRNILTYESFRDAGHGAHVALPMRMQRNGAFFGDYDFVDDGSDTFLQRVGLNPDGALYKMYSAMLVTPGAYEKKTRKWETSADLFTLDQGIAGKLGNKRNYLYNHTDIPAMVNFLAAMVLTGGVDCCHKNYYMYYDPATELWQALPWDVDLTFGRNFSDSLGYFDDKLYASNGLNVGSNQALMGALLADTAFNQMYMRRVRTLMDRMLQPTNTPVEFRYYEKRIQELSQIREADAALDLAKWKTWGTKQTMTQAIELMVTNYFPARRKYLFAQAGAGRPIPAQQPADVKIGFGAFEVTPPSGLATQEFIQLQNTNRFAVDISDWRLVGDIEHTLHPGTVIPANGSLYLTPDLHGFRGRTTAPRGNQGLNVQAAYRGQMSARGGTVQLVDGFRDVAQLVIPANPTPAQQYLRISEILFNSPVGANSVSTSTDGGQFVELVNIGPGALDLSQVRFTAGIQFAFATGAITTLGPNERVIVVRDLATFNSRYGAGLPVAGRFEGRLDPDGETLRLEEMGEVVLEFAYSAEWEARTRGPGYALVTRNNQSAWTSWKNRSQWTAGIVAGGTPGLSEEVYFQWLAAQFTGAERNDPAKTAPFADPDGDSTNNIQELSAGSDPTDPASPFALTVTSNVAGSVDLSFRAVGNRSYALEYLESLADISWIKLSDFPAGAARQITFTDPLGGLFARYYRVLVSPKP